MELNPSLQATLIAVANAMADAQAPWWIIASAAVALHGAVKVEVGDVDVLLHPDDALRLLPSLGIVPQRGADHPDFRSEIFGSWPVNPLPVEFMAGFHHRRGAQWHLVAPTTRQAVMVANATLYIPARDELRAMIAGFGRPKDRLRAQMLADLGAA